jgi:mRNA-decapping enzyme subunit 2
MRDQVWEETGYDISPHFNPNVRPHNVDSSTCPPPLPEGVYTEDDYIEVMMKEQRIRLYVIPQVSENTLFETKTRKEISVSGFMSSGTAHELSDAC